MKVFALIALFAGITQNALSAEVKTNYYSGQYWDFYDLIANIQQEGSLPRKLVLTMCKGIEPGNTFSFVQQSIDPIAHKVTFVSQRSPKQILELSFNKDWSKLEGTASLSGAAEGPRIQFWKDNKVEHLGCGA